MLRRCALRIVQKNYRPSLLLSCKNSSPSCFSFRASNASVNEQQFIRSITGTAVRKSSQTNVMEGDQGDRRILNLDYEALLEAQKNDVLIIDVREQNEINETGKLPGSIHIPMGNVSNLLKTLSDQAFQKTYEKLKPDKDTKIVLSCRSGMRSGKVQEELQKLGYENVYNYTGGWLEWESKQKV